MEKPEGVETEEKVAENGSKDTPKLNSKDKEIIRQIEYYFGDMNLPKDKFMQEQIKIDEGWIPMSVMFKFQRLAKLTTDQKVVASALRHSQLIEVNESLEDYKIRRSPNNPLPELNEERRKDLQERTIYCKGFPKDAVIDEIITFYENYGPYENIYMRRYKDKLANTFMFKGSVFVTFKTKEKGQEFLDIPDLKYKETVLLKKWQVQYFEDKKKERDTEKSMKGKNKKHSEEPEKPKVEMPKGAVVHLKGLFNSMAREDIKKKFADEGFEVAYVNFKRGDSEAHVRLSEENAGKNFVEKVGNEIEILESKLEVRVLEGDEEKDFIIQANADKNAYLKKCQQSRHGGRKGKGGQRNDRGRKRRGRDEEESSPPKKTKAAE